MRRAAAAGRGRAEDGGAPPPPPAAIGRGRHWPPRSHRYGWAPDAFEASAPFPLPLEPADPQQAADMGSLAKAFESPAGLRQMLALGGSPNSELDSDLGWRLLHKAAADNRTEALSILLDHDAELEAVTKDGRTALDLALERSALDALRLLLERGANPNGGPNKAEPTLHLATKKKRDERYLHLLLDHGASCDIRDVHGDLPIHRACLEENVRAAELLLRHWQQACDKHGARGFTPLHIAANMSNSNLFFAILRFGPRLDLFDVQERTPIDIVLAKQDTSILEGMGQWMVSPVLTSGGTTIQKLLAKPQGQRFLRLLRTVDNEFQHKFGYNESDEETNVVDTSLLVHIRDSEKFDINEFVDIVLKACSGGLTDEIVKQGMVGKVADNVLKHILLPQNETLLQEVMKLGLLWSAVVSNLENRIFEVYNKSIGEQRKDGIKGLIYRTCLDDESGNQVCGAKVHKLVANLTRFWQLQLVRESDECSSDSDKPGNCGETKADAAANEGEEQLHAMRDPVHSLAVWSVLTGRLRLAPHLLRQEDFDVIPQALLLAKMLRSLSRRQDIEDVYTNKAAKMAITCESIAMQALRRIKDVDVTPNNSLTMELVMLPLETFGGYSILELAAKGESSNFVIIDIVQEALNRLWYKDFFFARKDSHESMLMELAIACGFVPPLLPVTAKLMPHFRVQEPDYLKLSKSTSSDLETQKGCKFEDATEISPSVSLLPSKGHCKSSEDAKATLGPLSELLRFYQTPCVKFRIHVAAHITFVFLLSFVVMFQLGKTISLIEKICYITLLGFLVEEINEMITSAREETVKDYFLDGWNIIDLTAITCGFTAFGLRVNNTDAIQRYWSLVLLTTTCLVYWVRLLYVSVVLESLGPKLKMMSLMVKQDFLPFLYILFVLMFGFGVTFHALEFPEGKSIQASSSKDPQPRESAQEIMLGMFRNTFYAIVGEYGLDKFDKANVCNMSDIDGTSSRAADDGDDPNCVHPIGAVLVPTVFMVLYIVVMQILLLNVIVAMFSKTIDAINSESKAMWQFEKFDLVEEFNTRSAMPPPLNILSELRNLVVYVWRKMQKRSERSDSESRPSLSAEAAAVETPKDCKVYMLSLYYQALAFRNSRASFNGVVMDEEDLDEGNKIIFQQVNSINEKLERFDRLEDTVQKLEVLVKELKAISLKGPSNIGPKRASVMVMPYIEEGRE